MFYSEDKVANLTAEIFPVFTSKQIQANSYFL